MDNGNVLSWRQWKAFDGLAKLFLGPISATRERYLKFVADFSQCDGRDSVFWGYPYERLFPYFYVKLVAIPSFHGVSGISFAEIPREGIRTSPNGE
jgi:hypothetical protein